MMESWPGRQGQYCYYSKFGTVPGRSCTHNYHERHQTPHYPVRYDELQQNQSRDCSHWTVPGSRADRHHRQDVRGYRTHEVPEWTAAWPATRDHDKGLLREEWQKKWDLSNQVPCNRDTLGTRSESNYRELEAWATRYRHSLPRRRRIEAELRGASQRTVDDSRTDHQMTTMQHTKKSPINREFGLYPSKAPTSNTSHMMGMKENTGYLRMMFNQPPGYTAPPPYNSQHKVSPVYHYRPSNWEKDGKRPVSRSWSHFSMRLHDGPTDNRIGEKEGFKMSDESQSNTKLKGLKAQREDANTLQTGSPISVLNTQRRLEHMQPQQYSSEKPKTIGETLSRVIEGRKFKLEKKTGGMTIFCLVSRMAANTETPSLLYSKTNPESAETEYVPQTQRLSTPTHKLADEVDFTASTLTDQTQVFNVKNLSDGQKESLTPMSKKQEDDVLSSKACAQNEAEMNRKDEWEQPVSTKYPLWREPRYTSRTEKVNKDVSDGGEHVCVQVVSQPVDSEISKHDIKEKADDKKGLLVTDTTCVLVKMELIQSPNKEHVLYLGSPGGDHRILLDDQTVESKCPLRETTDEDTQTNPSPEAKNNNQISPGQEEHITEEKEDNVMSSPESESETFEERAERILGIPLNLCTKKLEAERLIAVNDLNAKKKEAGSSEQSITEEEQSQSHQQVIQSNKSVRLTENDHRVEMIDNDGENALASHSKGAQSSGEEEASMDLTHLATTDHCVLESPCDNNNHVENDEEHQTEDDGEECAEMARLVTAERVFLPQLTSPKSVDCSSVSTSHTDSSSSSPPPLDSNSQSAKVLCDIESQDEELITDSVYLNKTDEVFAIAMQQLNDCQPDDAVSDLFEPQSEEALKENFGAAEEEPFSATTLQQLFESVNMDDGDDDEPKTRDTTEQQSPTEGSQEPLGILSHCTEYGEEEKKCEIEVKTCEEKAGNTTANVQSQENHEELLTSYGASTEAQNNTTDTETDAEHSLDLSASDCEEPQPTSDELTCPELVSPDSVSFLALAPASSPNPGSACGVPQKDPSLLCEPLHFSVLDQVFCSTSPDEEHTCHDEAHKVHLQHPQSLREVVSRIRKHTAPDSENEEEEVSEPWDPENLHPVLLFTDVLMDCSERVDEDRLSCSSISSHSSGDTVIVAEETARYVGEPSEVETEVEVFDKAEDLCCCGENTAEDKQEDNKMTDMSESSLSEE
ncbi:uncharacterized protein LOC114463568 isoform X2 [Gouania willdenowi]|uniref:uncharacterized protein LOC114463568 isoform X2 n=1 Tax=Gouania willdenowi TaxID=441366 RepID=UPI0010549710|nr:uncharacterized protein LOC114463568 isoform X2 [Gouania willdenowi]